MVPRVLWNPSFMKKFTMQVSPKQKLIGTGMPSKQLTGTTAAFESFNIVQVAFALFLCSDKQQRAFSEYESAYLNLCQLFFAELAKLKCNDLYLIA